MVDIKKYMNMNVNTDAVSKILGIKKTSLKQMTREEADDRGTDYYPKILYIMSRKEFRIVKKYGDTGKLVSKEEAIKLLESKKYDFSLEAWPNSTMGLGFDDNTMELDEIRKL